MFENVRHLVVIVAVIAAAIAAAAGGATYAIGRSGIAILEADLHSLVSADYSADPNGISLPPLDEQIVDEAREDEESLSRTPEPGESFVIVPILRIDRGDAPPAGPTATPSASFSPTSEPTDSDTPTASPTQLTRTPTPSPRPSAVSTPVPTTAPTPTKSPPPTASPTRSPTPTPLPTPSLTPTASPTATPVTTATQTPTPTTDASSTPAPTDKTTTPIPVTQGPGPIETVEPTPAPSTSTPTATIVVGTPPVSQAPTPTPTPTPSPTPTPTATVVPGAVTWYLHNNPSPPSGDTSSQVNLPLNQSLPAGTVLYNYDTDRDSTPGLMIQKGATGANETDNAKQQMWRTSAFSSPLILGGTATFRVYTAMKDFKVNKTGSITVFLQDFDGSGYTTICQGTLTQPAWSGGSSTWVIKVISFDCPTYTVAAGHQLAVKVIVGNSSDDDMVFAYDTNSYPSRLELAASPTPTATPTPTPSPSATPGPTPIPNNSLNLQANGVDLSIDTSPSGDFEINAGDTSYFTAGTQVIHASNAADWTLVLVQKSKPYLPTTVKVSIWWQQGGNCDTGAVSGQVFATADWMIPIATDARGITIVVTKSPGSVSHLFEEGDLFCMSIQNTGIISANDVEIRANSLSETGAPGVSHLEGPFIFTPSLNLEKNGNSMSTGTSTAGNLDIIAGETKTFTATGIDAVSNVSDWTLFLVLRDQPDVVTPVTVTIWWQNASQCTIPVANQIFAIGTISVPVAQDGLGVSFIVPGSGSSAGHTFMPSDRLCLSLANVGSGAASDLQLYANIASTTGAAGFTRLQGPFLP